MKFVENTDSEYRNELSLWLNKEGDIWMQLGTEEEDPYSMQGMVLDINDAKVLVAELARLIAESEGACTKTPLPKQALKLENGQLGFSKVDWSK